MQIPGNAKNGFWLVIGGVAALWVAAIVLKKL